MKGGRDKRDGEEERWVKHCVLLWNQLLFLFHRDKMVHEHAAGDLKTALLKLVQPNEALYV